MDNILKLDYERAMRSNHPKFIQEVIFRLIRRYDSLIDPLAERAYFMDQGYKRKTSAQYKIERLLRK